MRMIWLAAFVAYAMPAVAGGTWVTCKHDDYLCLVGTDTKILKAPTMPPTWILIAKDGSRVTFSALSAAETAGEAANP